MMTRGGFPATINSRPGKPVAKKKGKPPVGKKPPAKPSLMQATANKMLGPGQC